MVGTWGPPTDPGSRTLPVIGICSCAAVSVGSSVPSTSRPAPQHRLRHRAEDSGSAALDSEHGPHHLSRGRWREIAGGRGFPGLWPQPGGRRGVWDCVEESGPSPAASTASPGGIAHAVRVGTTVSSTLSAGRLHPKDPSPAQSQLPQQALLVAWGSREPMSPCRPHVPTSTLSPISLHIQARG